MNQEEEQKLIIYESENKNLMIWILENETFRSIHIHCSWSWDQETRQNLHTIHNVTLQVTLHYKTLTLTFEFW